MRFERVVIARFGGLRDLDTGGGLPALVVFAGPNEAGKSSVFAAMTSILYGFLPASRQRHPYAPWSGGELDVRAEIRLGGGEPLAVHRRLGGAPWGRVQRSDRVDDIRNRPLPEVDGVARTLFEQVYALTLDELSGMTSEEWSGLQDRLLLGMGARDLVPPGRVARDLEREGASLWRPGRRGKPRARVLQASLRELRSRRSVAEDADRELRRQLEELGRLRDRLRDVRAEREKLREREAVLGRLMPYREEIRRLREDVRRVDRTVAGELDTLRREIDADGVALFGDSWPELDPEVLLEAPLDHFERRVEEYGRARDAVRVRREARRLVEESGTARPFARPGVLATALAASGLLLVTVGFRSGDAVSVLVGLVALVVGLMGWAFRRGLPGRDPHPDRSGDTDVSDAELERLRLAAAAPLSILPLRPELVRNPGPEVARRIGAVRDALGRARALENERSAARTRLADARTALEAELMRSGDGPVADSDVEEGPAHLDRLRARERTLSAEIESLLGDVERREAEVRRLQEAESVAEIDGLLAEVGDELRMVRRERDRRLALARLVREAERRFRAEHQPDILRRCGEYVRVITGGRYDRLLPDVGAPATPFRLAGPGVAETASLAQPLSTGTRDQVYLSLRLAALDHLDRSGERLPLFLDEVLVNWDGTRRGRGLELLRETSRHRQVFVFTCHEAIEEELAELGARVIRMGE